MQHFPELKPENVISEVNLEKNDKQAWKKMLNYCPELQYRNRPKDREFFFNILNTVKLHIVDKMIQNAIRVR